MSVYGNKYWRKNLRQGPLCKELVYRYKGELKHKNIWIYGKGCDKTSFIYDYYGYDNVYLKQKNRFFDGYTSQKCILIKDVDKKFMKKEGSRMLVEIGDAYVGVVEVRRDWTYMYPDEYSVIVTSDYKPDDIVDPSYLAQIKRRFCVISFPYVPTDDGN